MVNDHYPYKMAIIGRPREDGAALGSEKADLGRDRVTALVEMAGVSSVSSGWAGC